MTFDDVAATLARHANLPSPRAAAGSLCAELRAARREYGHEVPVVAARDELFACLEWLNHAYNGVDPTAAGAADGRRSHLDRTTVYSMACILEDGWRYVQQAEVAGLPRAVNDDAVATLIYELTIAWSAVLAGDIADLRGHVRDERRARA